MSKYSQASYLDYNGRGSYFGKIVQKARCHAVPKALPLSKNMIHATVKTEVTWSTRLIH
jgi:hypothetical protein